MSESSLTAVELRMRIFLVLTLLFVGCKKENSGFCTTGVDCPDGAPMSCTMSQGNCVCHEMFCVECTVDDERNCGGTRPQCGDDNTCRACSSNDDCGSGACLEDGSCAAPGRVIYASPSGVNMADCGKEKGMPECSIAQALMEVNSSRDVIRLAPGTYTVPSGVDGLDFSGKSATVVARDAILVRPASSGALMTARNGQTLKLIGGTLQGPTNTTDGLKCNTNSKLLVHEVTIENMIESGIESDNCELTVSRSTIRGNFKGGINMVPTAVARIATITNNFVYGNGKGGTVAGGMFLKLASGSRLEFNTVVDNTSNTTAVSAGGIVCDGQGYDAPFNLIYRNVGGLDNKYQVNGTCTFTNSYKLAAMLPTENAVFFEAPNDTPPSFRLTKDSPAEVRDVADCREIDFERDVRPAGGKCDYGADEYREGQERGGQ